MKLSIVIVNYNVSHFLAQCLTSVQKAINKIDADVWVVDNASSDGSVAMVRQDYNWVNLIANKKNVGFSKANNQAIKASKGEYVLLLNPDTVVKEDTFIKCIHFMDEQPKAGGLGVHMVDGKGVFLPESKRSLPTPDVSFYKIFGLATLFPKSKRFGKYHLGHLSEHENHKVEILSGAYMFMRRSVLNEVGLLDETFFMYGEDIDLSYRIIKGGYDNYYFSDTSIIHYKGESTKKGSINYVMVFYKAMIIFAKKHFSKQYARLFGILINLAVYLRAFIAIVQRFAKNAIIPLIDGLGSALLFYGIQQQYAQYSAKVFPHELIERYLIAIPLIWMTSLFFSGGYDRPFKSKYIQRGSLAAMLLSLGGYALLSEDFRFSRFVLVASLAGTWILINAIRVLLNFSPFKAFHLEKKRAKRFGIVGSVEEVNRIKDILVKSNSGMDAVFFISPTTKRPQGKGYVGTLTNLKVAIQSFEINQLVFCAKDLSYGAIIDQLSIHKNQGIAFKIAPPNGSFVIGSDSINASGEYYSLVNLNTITKQTQRRNKRMVDLFFGLFFLLLSPILVWFQSHFNTFLVNCIYIISGKKSWVGFCKMESSNLILPQIKPGVLCPQNLFEKPIVFQKELEKLNIDYAKKYSVTIDIKIVLKNLTKLGS